MIAVPTRVGRSTACVWTVPGAGLDTRARLEVTFEPGRTRDGWANQLLEAGAHIAALLLDVERAQGRAPSVSRQAARRRRGSAHRIESRDQDAARTHRTRSPTDFTVLIEGAIGPQPHSSFIEFSNPTAVGNGCWQVAGAGADGTIVTSVGGATGPDSSLPNSTGLPVTAVTRGRASTRCRASPPVRIRSCLDRPRARYVQRYGLGGVPSDADGTRRTAGPQDAW